MLIDQLTHKNICPFGIVLWMPESRVPVCTNRASLVIIDVTFNTSSFAKIIRVSSLKIWWWRHTLCHLPVCNVVAFFFQTHPVACVHLNRAESMEEEVILKRKHGKVNGCQLRISNRQQHVERLHFAGWFCCCLICCVCRIFHFSGDTSTEKKIISCKCH